MFKRYFVLKIDILMNIDDSYIRRICEDYWKINTNGLFAMEIDFLAKSKNRSKKSLADFVQENCTAIVDCDSLNCKRCGKNSEFTSREQLEFVQNQNRDIYYNYAERAKEFGVKGIPNNGCIILDVCSSCNTIIEAQKVALQSCRKRKKRSLSILVKRSNRKATKYKRVIRHFAATVQKPNIQPQKPLSDYTVLEAWLLLCLNKTFKTINLPNRVYGISQTPFFGSEDYDLKVLTQLYSQSLIVPSVTLKESATKADYLNASWSFVLPEKDNYSKFINTLTQKQFGLTKNDVELLSEFIIEGRVRAMMDPINNNTGYWRVFGNTEDIKLNSALKDLVTVFPINHLEALSNIAAKDLAAKYHRTYNHLQRNPSLYLAGIIRYSELAQTYKDFKFYDRSDFFTYEPSAFEKQLSVLLHVTTPLGEVEFSEFKRKLAKYLV